jgi:autotransporter-associated beta strand protein
VTGTKALNWTGSVGGVWDSGITANTNWNDGVGADNFFAGDTVTFPEGAANPSVTVTSGVSPWKTSVTSNTTNFTLTSTANGISGPGNLEKSGNSTLTLVGPNTYSGRTIISGGTVSIASPTSLGNAATTNTISLSGGGRLMYTGNTAVDLGFTRSIAVGAGGGVLSHNNATAATISIPGNITGTGDLTFTSAAAGGGTFTLTGDNSGYSGNISVGTTSTGLTVLRLASQSAVPGGGSITLNFPAAGANGNAETLDLPNGITLPSSVGITMTTFLNGTTSLRSQINSAGSVTINSPITVTGTGTAQFQPSIGTLTLNGNITGDATFTGTIFLRTAGTVVVNGVVNAPNGTLSHTDGGTGIINSTGNVWAQSAIVSGGILKIGANNALPIAAPLTVGQSNDASASTFDLNGFNQELSNIIYVAGNGNSTRGITNTSATQSTLTINNSAPVTFGSNTGTTGGIISGNLALVKNGTDSLTLGGANTFTGNVTVNNGTLAAGGTQNTGLGSATTAGRTITVNSPGTLSFATNNVYGNGIGNANLPTTILNGSTLNSTRYNVLGDVTLNGATLSQSSSDTGNFEGFQFRGNVTVGGSSLSTISTGNGKADHLGPNTTFNVADATGSSATDLSISAPLRNQSGDFGTAAGGLTKIGAGTLELLATNTYTGPTIVNEGTLEVTGSVAGSTVTVNGGSLKGTGTLGGVILNPLGTLAPGASPGTLTLTDITFAGGTFSLEINGSGVGQADQLVASGSVSLTSNTPLTISLGYDPVDNVDSFVVVNNTGIGPISTVGGFFSVGGTPLSEGAIFAVSGQQFSISYQGGDGNDVVIAAVPEPSSFLALLGGCALLLGLRRTRRN